MNVLQALLRITIATLLASGTSQRDIEKRTGVHRKTIRRYAQAANAPRGGHRLFNQRRANAPTPATGSGRGARAGPPRGGHDRVGMRTASHVD